LIYNDFSASKVSVNLLVRGSIPRRGAIEFIERQID